jgi:hypothetical protein
MWPRLQSGKKEIMRGYNDIAAPLKAAFDVMRGIKAKRPWTQFRKMSLGCWKGSDGVMSWEILAERRNDGSGEFHLVVSSWGSDQMDYSWVGPYDGTPQEILENHWFARHVDLNGGELWRFLNVAPELWWDELLF